MFSGVNLKATKLDEPGQNELVHVGGCGTGWSSDLSRELRTLLEGMATKAPAVSLKRKDAVFVEPVLIAEVEYRAWTDDGKLPHASSKEIRERVDDPTAFDIQSALA
ncbi:hypothetical protein [Sinorhizobium meliloti]|uniref:ATP dependent DNA ligase n=1 Tax=Rhizobium meliloti TaxID=382 RepID=UPI0019117CB1|nr:hypothetical protein [Sinorhizobium meliloti]MDX0316636.1 hypothetical protein [Sinorhizobium meliloti]MDX0323134.1 hypothetical protein [Sinorhizobium meliloti]